MDVHVSNVARMAARNCKKELSCLRKERKDLCAVGESLFGITLECMHNDFCSFQYQLGDALFCSCQVRKELFNKYNI